MVSSSKILTVSYGTFSCTAEGFEDPLAVVKETTHFFRGVVGNDRFFGAEPPQFDAELAAELMRNHIAETREDSGTLTLGSAAASSGALSAALAAGPTRARSTAETAAEQAADPRDTLPDDDTIEATAVLTEVTQDAPVDLNALALDDTAHEGMASEDAAQAAPAPAEPDDMSFADTVAAATAEVTAPAPRPSTLSQANRESVAAKLDRIRAVVSSAAPMDDEDEEEAIAPAAPMSSAVQPDTPVEDAPFDMDSITSLFAEDTAEVTAPEIRDSTTPIDLSAEAYDDDVEEEDGETIVLSEPAAHTSDDATDDSAIGDEIDEDALSALLGEFSTTDATSGSDDDLSDLLAEDPAPQPYNPAALSESIADLVGAVEAEGAEAAPDVTEDVAEDVAEDAAEDDDAAEADQPAAPLRARVVKIKRADFLRAVEEGQLEEIDDSAEDASDDVETAASMRLPMAEESTLSPEEEDELARELAAVKAELSGEFDAWDDEDEDEDFAEVETSDRDAFAAAARADGWADESYYDDDEEDEEDHDNAFAAASPLRLDNPTVSAPTNATGWEDEYDDDEEDEGRPAAEHRWSADMDAIDARAAGEMDRTDSDEDDTEEDESLAELIRNSARKTVKMASPARVMLTEREIEDDDASRLMEQTDTEMDEPEGNRRRTAIAHLRAAVAATKADRLLGRRADAAEEQEPYREDLASVVRPRRPQPAAAAPRVERPADRPAPLKLVAEQRVSPAPAASEAPQSDLPRTVPVRPRRVHRVAEAPTRDAGSEAASEGFVQYAEEMGATELPELLEAAAAYMAYVEGRDQFSRPQLMSTVRLAEAEESSREDRLRSFGQLLREGKIKKTAGGRFTASDRISFKPDRAAG